MRLLMMGLLITLSVGVLAMDGAQTTGQWPESYALSLPDYTRFDGTPGFPSAMPLSNILRAALELMGEDLDLRWDASGPQGLRPDLVQLLFMGTTGEAFSFLWFPRTPERPPLDPALYWPDPAAPYRRALGAAGFGCEVLVAPGLGDGTGEGQSLDAQTLRDRVRGCLAERELPAIIAGIPEPGSFLLVAGYEDDGNALIGWRGSGGGPVSRNAADMVRVSDWTAAARIVVLLTGYRECQPERETMRSALEQAIGLLRMTQAGPYHAGPATFEAWAQALLSDDPPDLSVPPNHRPQSVEGRRRWLICPSAWDLQERAYYAARSCDRAAVVLPEAAVELQAASACMSEFVA